MKKGKDGIYNHIFKRLFDITAAGIVLLLFWWVFAITAVLVRTKLGSPVIFTQERPGKDGKIFKLYKFRTMTNAVDGSNQLLSDDDRLTPFGRKLRATSLDELPEIYNILKGDMSFIGPRPLLKEYLPFYSPEEFHRHDVRPGLSGLAQVNGRNNIDSWESRFSYDLEYVRNCSLGLDIKILFLTIYKVLKHSDIQVGSAIKAGRLDKVRGTVNEDHNPKI